MRRLILTLALVLWPVVSHAQDAGRGTLTILVRDPAGTPLPGVTIALFHDTDLDGPELVTTATTDAEGRITAPDLAWGLYIVQFQGTAPDGRPMLPADQQNMGVLTDGNGLFGGFGLRFAGAQRTELYVLGGNAGDGRSIPMFDMAASSADPPQPYDPVDVAAAYLYATRDDVVNNRDLPSGFETQYFPHTVEGFGELEAPSAGRAFRPGPTALPARSTGSFCWPLPSLKPSRTWASRWRWASC